MTFLPGGWQDFLLLSSCKYLPLGFTLQTRLFCIWGGIKILILIFCHLLWATVIHGRWTWYWGCVNPPHPTPPPSHPPHLTSSTLILSTHPCIGNAGPPLQRVWVFMSHFTSHLGPGLSTDSRCFCSLCWVCVHMRAWPHTGMEPKLFERLAFPMLTLWMKHGREDGVCHTLNWTMWRQPSLYGDCRDQLVALVKHCNGTIIKSGIQKKITQYSSPVNKPSRTELLMKRFIGLKSGHC